MKKLISILLTIAMLSALLAVAGVAVTTASAASGTPVSNVDEFLSMRPTGNYYLANDITIPQMYGIESDGYFWEFSGTFDGNGKTITLADTAEGFNSVFFMVLEGTVKNLTIKGNTVMNDPGTGYGALAFFGSGKFENITSEVNITVSAQMQEEPVAGLVSTVITDTEFVNCTNKGNITVNGDAGLQGDLLASMGGIAGAVEGGYYGTVKFRGCTNEGKLVSTQKRLRIGGILGFARHTCVELLSCENKGDIEFNSDGTGEGGAHTGVGGIFGCFQSPSYADGAVVLDNCINRGEISVVNGGRALDAHVGGIMGRAFATPTIVATGCINYGKMNVDESEDWSGTGGIIGSIMTVSISYSWSQLESAEYTFQNCENHGDIFGRYAGGIVGSSWELMESGIKMDFQNCVNTGVVSGTVYSGGIFGKAGCDEINSGASRGFGNLGFFRCLNIGEVDGGGMSGGILGVMIAGSLNHTDITIFDACANSGRVSCDSATSKDFEGKTVGAAGILGYTARPVTIKNCVNAGALVGPDANPTSIYPITPDGVKEVTVESNIWDMAGGASGKMGTAYASAMVAIKTPSEYTLAFDRKSLTTAISNAKALDPNSFTSVEWGNILTKITAAESLLANSSYTKLTQKQVNEAMSALSAAIPYKAPQATEPAQKPTEKPKADEDKKDDKKGCGSAIGVGTAALVVVSVLGSGIVFKKKES